MYVSLGVCPFEVPVPVVVEDIELRGAWCTVCVQSQHCAAANQLIYWHEALKIFPCQCRGCWG